MPQIEIRDINQNLKAILTPESDGVKEVWVDRRVNAEHTLEFMLPVTNEKFQEIAPECRIIAGNREFIILKPDAIDEVREGQKLWGKVMAQESWKLLGRDYPTISNDPQKPPETATLEVTIISGGDPFPGYTSGTAANALAYLLDGTGWTLGTVDVTGIHDLETEKESTLANIQKVQEIWGGLLIWEYGFDSDGKVNLRRLHLRKEEWQVYTGFQVRYAKNLKHITRTANNDITTRLYPFGENDLDIASVNGGVKYLENFQYTNNVYMGTYRNQRITDPQELKDEGIKVLDKLSKPRFTYRTGLVDLRTLPEYSHEHFEAGHMVDVIDDDLGFNILARVVRHKYNLFQPWKCELEIGEPEDRLETRLKDSFDASKYIREVAKPNTGFANLLKGALDTYATIVLGANGQFETIDGISTWKNGETGQEVRISPGGILITQDAGQNWDTAITGLGIAGQAIIAGSIIGDKIAANTITANNIAAGTITGNKIAAGTITASNIAAGTITGTEIAANTITAGKLNVGELSAISANLGSITAGTITGALFRTAASGQRIQFDSNGLRGFNASNQVHGISIIPGSVQQLNFYNNGTLVGQLVSSSTGILMSVETGNNLIIGLGGNTIRPQGTWNFADATIQNLSVSYATNAGYATSAGSAGYASDSDKLDGYHASAFAFAGHDHGNAYVKSMASQNIQLQWFSNYVEVWVGGIYRGKVNLT